METTAFEPPRIASLLKHFAAVKDFRDSWRVAHPLPEVLLLVVCGTIAAGDDYEGIVDWGNARLSFLRRFLPFHFEISCGLTHPSAAAASAQFLRVAPKRGSGPRC